MNKIAFSQFCDDIRQEANGKFIIIGCYGDTMQVKSFPVNMRMSVFVTYTCRGGSRIFNANLKLASGALVGTAKIEVEENPYDESELAAAQIPVSGLQVMLSREDELVFEFGVDDETPREIGRLKIELIPQLA